MDRNKQKNFSYNFRYFIKWNWLIWLHMLSIAHFVTIQCMLQHYRVDNARSSFSNFDLIILIFLLPAYFLFWFAWRKKIESSGRSVCLAHIKPKSIINKWTTNKLCWDFMFFSEWRVCIYMCVFEHYERQWLKIGVNNLFECVSFTVPKN